MRKAIPLIIWMCLLHYTLHANNHPQLLELLDKIKASRIIIQNSSTAFLLTCKQLGSDQLPKERIVRIAIPMASIRDADLITAGVLIKIQSGTLLPVLKKEGEWFQVRLPDLRDGWIHQDDVQQMYDEEARGIGNQEMDPEIYYQTRLLAENFFLRFSEAFQKTEQHINDFEKKYHSFSAAEQQNTGKLYEEMNRERELINLARAYTNHYHQKLPPLQVIPSGRTNSSKTIGFDGTASVRFGSSAYESGGQISETTRSISLAGNIIFNPQSRLAVQLNHNKDVIRTPYTSSDVNATYYHEASGGTRLSTSVNFQDYGDEFLNQNSYRNLGARVNVEHPLSENIRIMGDVQGQLKNYYDTEDGNDFLGVQINTYLDYSGKKARVNAGIRGRLQSSDIAFLDYHRIIPNLRLTYKAGQKTWSAYGEAEQMVYGSTGESNNFNRIRADLESYNSKNRTQLTVINKSFPNNGNFNNLKIRILSQINHRSTDRNGRTTGYAEYTFHTNDNTTSSNFVDLRLDRNFSRKTSYLDIGAFGRYWENTGIAHRLSLYSRFGLKFSGIQIGPVVGADILIDLDNPDLERVGNSYRAGVDGRGNFLIRQATVYSSVRYQYSLAYSGLNTDGNSGTRKPMTLEITAGTKIPVARRFELQLDLRYYSLDYDFPDIEDPLPIQKQSGLRYLAGISYRF